MQTTTTTALGWVQYKRRMIASIVDETVEKLENSYTAGEIVKWQSYFRKQSRGFSIGQRELPRDPAIPLFHITLKE